MKKKYAYLVKSNGRVRELEYVNTLGGFHVFRELPFMVYGNETVFIPVIGVSWFQEVCEITASTTTSDYMDALRQISA